MLMNMHDDADAQNALERAVALDPKNTIALNNLAWFHATCFHQSFRNLARAIRLAKQANDLGGWKNPNDIDTYAAALDLAGKHADAAIAEQQAVSLAPKRTDLQNTLKKYQSEATAPVPQ